MRCIIVVCLLAVSISQFANIHKSEMKEWQKRIEYMEDAGNEFESEPQAFQIR